MSRKKRTLAAALASLAGATAIVLTSTLPAAANTVGFGAITCGSGNVAVGTAYSSGTTTFTFVNPAANPSTKASAIVGGSSYTTKSASSGWTQISGGNASANSVQSASRSCLAS